ncbi:hypothetical protein ES288_D13G109600v1 [Gossypium darwinii]|uniref:Uncharacterized protein n=1 Tax=Gossypium darwinii TaxID=34276 RepID=A0A5D1ZWR6_GOSDA|nr:hypothetical protein ES288_D13G109600v1 [Gossypium darwinii]
MNSAPLVPSQTHSIDPTPIDLSSPTLQRQCMSCLINQSRHCKVRYLIKKHTQIIDVMCNQSEHRFIFLILLNIFYNCQRIAFHNQSTETHYTRED